jgi:cardiolipin synthase
MYWQSGLVIMIATATDVVDGWIARHFNMITDWGKFIDPLADKLMQFAMLIMAIFKNPWISILVAIFAIKEAIMLAVGIYIYHKGENLNGAMWCGKLSTVVLDSCLFLIIVLPAKYIKNVNVFILIGLSAIFLILSFIIYMREYLKMYKEMKADGTIQTKSK